jgi:hypothetical protein
MLKALGPKGYLKIDNALSTEAADFLKGSFSYSKNQRIQKEYGRAMYDSFTDIEFFKFRGEIELDLPVKVNTLLGTNFSTVEFSGLVEYNLNYGEPNLPPHFDGDSTDLIFNYQIESNTVWPLGVDEDVIELGDNSALLFNPNASVHWRPIKKFEVGEYVKMAFFRFKNTETPSNYNHLRLSQDDSIFDSARKVRETFKL